MASRTIFLSTVLSGVVTAGIVRTPTPPMGWNSYNAYSCNATEKDIKVNAQGLIDTGLADLGYTYVTADCGWNLNERDAEGRLQWDPERFPSGGKGLANYIHELDLKFGVYSGGGYYQCGSEDLPASLGHEKIDAQSFAEWRADSLKYDNCYAVDEDEMVNYEHPEAGSPNRFRVMAEALNATDRDVLYQVCQWGCGTNLGIWAPRIGGGTWRISNDIENNWKSIWRITNEVVPYAKHTSPGRFPDMDMLIVGLNGLSVEEERFHFGMWAINKSPLTIGCNTLPDSTPASSLDILQNEEVIALNQDPLSKSADLLRRYTEEEWDIWAGELSDDRRVIGLANWKNESQSVSVDLKTTLGIKSATARDPWARRNISLPPDVYKTELAPHQLQLLVLSDITPSDVVPKSMGYNPATQGTLSGSAKFRNCSSEMCSPTGTVIGSIQGKNSTVAFSSVSASSPGVNLVGVDFINYEVALGSAWEDGTNTMNMTIAVNGGKPKRWAFPISGGSWSESGRLLVEADGFEDRRDNEVVFAGTGIESLAPDFVGFEILEYAKPPEEAQ